MRRFLPLILLFAIIAGSCIAEDAAPDYSDPESWAYYGVGEDRAADLFLICPTVDLGLEGNYNISLDDAVIKQEFLGALNMERGIYEAELKMYAPYYRQVSLPVFYMPEREAAPYFEIAYSDVRSAFLTFVEQTNRPFVLAGFSQGSYMALRLMKEFFDDPALQDRLIAAYCIGWRITDDDVRDYPWLKPATRADDTGSIICFATEAADIKGSLFVPEGIKTHSINPLNWSTDGTMADAALNIGACFTDYSGAILNEAPALTGAYIDAARGVIVPTDLIPADYTNPLFPDGVYHLFDYQFFYRNLQANVALRVDAYLEGRNEGLEDAA